MASAWKLFVTTLFILSSGIAALIPGPSGVLAASGPDCFHYDYQSDAQRDLDDVLENYPEIAEVYAQLDEDGDGVACPDLPERPEILDGAVPMGGHVEIKSEALAIDGCGVAACYEVHFAGTSLDPKASALGADASCPELLTEVFFADQLDSKTENARRYYLLPIDNEEFPPETGDSGTLTVNARAWTILDDPAHPVLVNWWLVRNGLAFFDAKTINGETETEIQEAEAAAKKEGIGVWGDCEAPSSLIPDQPTPTGRLFQESGTGDQIVRFTVTAEGTYAFTLNTGGGEYIFVSLDVYSLDGTWHPEFGIIASEGGSFSSAGYLPVGEYYVQITATGLWEVSAELLL